MNAASGSELSTEFGPWNPGVASDLSSQLMALCTIFREENAFTTLTEVQELAGVTGLELSDLVVFRPERLALHELLVRVTADIEVPDPEHAKVNSLGIEFRRIVESVHTQYVVPHMGEIVRSYESLRGEIATIIEKELALLFDRRAPLRPPGQRRWLRKGVQTPLDGKAEWEGHEQVVSRWSSEAQRTDRTLLTAVYGSLAKVVTAIRMKHGRIWGDQSFVASIATGLACNDYVGEMIGQLIDSHVKAAVMREGLRVLPNQERPIVMSTKGASASGKSTMRPRQRKLAARMGAQWGDFALISPDIFRRSLLDFDSLGSLYKFAGIFTSHELNIVDSKLDRHMARKAAIGATPHLLIDRFRFDSFVPNSQEQWQLPARLGRPLLIHFLFMVTPPEKTVERAWKRGLEVGRYKPVSDLLAHNVEAYSGIPGFFLARVFDPQQVIHFEFLDNDVPAGAQPLTIAFGLNSEMHVLDVKGMLNIDRYRRINVNATNPGEVYLDYSTSTTTERYSFLARCVQRFQTLTFADRATGRKWALVEAGRLRWCDHEAMSQSIKDDESRSAIEMLFPNATNGQYPKPVPAPEYLNPDGFYTIGQWGEFLDPCS
jgi:hypothetical protein